MSEIAISEVNKLADDKEVYHSIGRIFVLRKHEEEVADQQKDIDSYKKRIGELAKQKEYLTKSLHDAEKGLRELVQQSRVEKA